MLYHPPLEQSSSDHPDSRMVLISSFGYLNSQSSGLGGTAQVRKSSPNKVCFLGWASCTLKWLHDGPGKFTRWAHLDGPALSGLKPHQDHSKVPI